MDVSIVDMSMQDVELEVLKDLQKGAAKALAPKSLKAATAKAAARRTALPRKPAARPAATARRKAAKATEAVS
jgi:NAD+-dependent protein deacetylase SIR2